MSQLFQPLSLRQLTLPNRIAVSPMCQYSAKAGMANDWHLVHLGSRAGGAGLVIVEATAVSPDGRISPEDLGIWSDEHVEPLRRITRFIEAQGSVAGGAAGPCRPQGEHLAALARQAWQRADRCRRLDAGGAVRHRLLAGACRAHCAGRCRYCGGRAGVRRGGGALIGCRFQDRRSACGPWLHQFLSPLSNQRQDRYGGSFDNRIRLLLEVTAAVRQVWPEELPLFVRLSATDWVDDGWNADETVELARRLKDVGVDLIDVSSGGTAANADIPVGPGYQTQFAERVRKEAGIATGTVGMITEAVQAEHILRTGQADLILLARELLRDPYWPLHAAEYLRDGAVAWPAQYVRAAHRDTPIRQVPESFD